MGRPKGEIVYRGKTEAGSHYLTKVGDRLMARAAKRWRKGEADVLEHCLRAAAGSIDRTTEPIPDDVASGKAPAGPAQEAGPDATQTRGDR